MNVPEGFTEGFSNEGGYVLPWEVQGVAVRHNFDLDAIDNDGVVSSLDIRTECSEHGVVLKQVGSLRCQTTEWTDVR